MHSLPVCSPSTCHWCSRWAPPTLRSERDVDRCDDAQAIPIIQVSSTFSIAPPAAPIRIVRSERTALYGEFQRRCLCVFASAAFSDATRRDAKDLHAVTRLFSSFAPIARLPNPPLDSWSLPRHAPVMLVSKDMYAPNLPERESVGSWYNSSAGNLRGFPSLAYDGLR
jgi:hypothetical protein